MAHDKPLCIMAKYMRTFDKPVWIHSHGKCRKVNVTRMTYLRQRVRAPEQECFVRYNHINIDEFSEVCYSGEYCSPVLHQWEHGFDT